MYITSISSLDITAVSLLTVISKSTTSWLTYHCTEVDFTQKEIWQSTNQSIKPIVGVFTLLHNCTPFHKSGNLALLL